MFVDESAGSPLMNLSAAALFFGVAATIAFLKSVAEWLYQMMLNVWSPLRAPSARINSRLLDSLRLFFLSRASIGRRACPGSRHCGSSLSTIIEPEQSITYTMPLPICGMP